LQPGQQRGHRSGARSCMRRDPLCPSNSPNLPWPSMPWVAVTLNRHGTPRSTGAGTLNFSLAGGLVGFYLNGKTPALLAERARKSGGCGQDSCAVSAMVVVAYDPYPDAAWAIRSIVQSASKSVAAELIQRLMAWRNVPLINLGHPCPSWHSDGWLPCL